VKTSRNGWPLATQLTRSRECRPKAIFKKNKPFALAAYAQAAIN
jgi:hypothetical protein